MPETAEDTKVQQVEIADINDILGIPGADNVIMPDDINQNNLFKRDPKVDTSFLNPKNGVESKEPIIEIKDTKEKLTEENVADIKEVLEDITPTGDAKVEKGPEDDQKKSPGRKEGILELTKKLIEQKLLVPFEDEKALEDYTLKDFEELIVANFKNQEDTLKAKTPVEFFDSLPEQLQVAAKYVADGGQDLKGLFQVLAQAEETRELNPADPKDSEAIVKEYLRITNFGDLEEIEEEIVSWKDLNKLEEKAAKFKPKLDQMREKSIAQKLARQENLRKQQQEASQHYMNDIYETLKPGELNGLKIDKKIQGMLYNGLVQPQYPSMSGKTTNLLGHLLEKYQFVEPNHGLIAEALWLLADPEGYKAKIKDGGKNEQVIDTVRKLKTEEGKNKNASSPIIEKDETTEKKLARNDNFFKR
jgi:hypothetical protein